MHHHLVVLTFTPKLAMTITTSFFLLPLFLTLLLPPCHGTTSGERGGDSDKTLSPQNVFPPKIVGNVVITPKDVTFFPRKSPPFFFQYFYRFPLTAYRHPSPPPSVPMAPTTETSASSPPSNSPPAEPKSPQPKPPTVPRWSRQWTFLAPPTSPVGNTGKQGTPIGNPGTPQWPRLRPFPRWKNLGSATLPILPPKNPNWLHPKLFPWWSRPRFFVGHPYLLHPKPFLTRPVQGSSDAYPFRLPVRSHWPSHISNRPPMQNKSPVQHP